MKSKNPYKKAFQWVSLFVGALSLVLAFYFVGEKRCDPNFTYYLISVSAIYSTIVLAYLQQKISFLHQQKEQLIEKSKPLWNALLHYRLLCFSMVDYFNQNEYKLYQKVLALKLTQQQLGTLDFLPNDMIDPTLLATFKGKFKKEEEQRLALAIGFAHYFAYHPSNITSDAGYINRVYASNNSSVNAYIGLLINNGAFNLLSEARYSVSKLDEFLKSIVKERSFAKLVSQFSILGTGNMTRLKTIEREILNGILFNLHDATFLIEKKLPFHFVFVLWNAFSILLLGTIIPLLNAFTLQSHVVLRFCGGMTVGLLLMALTFIFLVFHYENSKELFRNSSVIYQGQNNH
jgi:hypothetical protein